ncbi:MAG: insulinase family protein [Myxococcaceae bacterium]|nr:insulinase family protein [Myxococcaceae bacterium]
MTTALLLVAVLAAPGPVTQEQLADGTVLLVVPQPGATDVAVRWVVRAGADDEPASRAGLAHLVEHLAFRSPSAEQQRGVITRAQGRLNASTTATATTFELDVPRASFEQGFGALVHLVTAIDTSPGAVRSEVGVVHHENALRRRERNGSIERAVFGDRVVGGDEQTLGRATRSDVVSFLERFYRPGRTTLIIVGDVTAEVVKRVVDAESRWPPTAVAELKPLPPVPERVRVSVSDFAYGQAIVAERFAVEHLDACRLHAAARHLQALRVLPPSRTTVASDCVVVHGWAFALVLAFSLEHRAADLLEGLMKVTQAPPRALAPKDLTAVERRLKAREASLRDNPSALAEAIAALAPYLEPAKLVDQAQLIGATVAVSAAAVTAARGHVLGDPIIIVDGPFPDAMTRLKKPAPAK